MTNDLRLCPHCQEPTDLDGRCPCRTDPRLRFDNTIKVTVLAKLHRERVLGEELKRRYA